MENVLVSMVVGSTQPSFDDRTGQMGAIYITPVFSVNIPALYNAIIAEGFDPADYSIAISSESAESNVKDLYDAGVKEAVVDSQSVGGVLESLQLTLIYKES